MLMHLSQLAGYILFPVVGLVLPIIMWASTKDESKEVNAHGKNILNWMISVFIYEMIACFMIFFLIGIPMLIFLVMLSFIFAIIGAIKARDGIYYKYPFSITFFR